MPEPLFNNKVAGLRPANLLKRDSDAGVFSKYTGLLQLKNIFRIF